VPGSRRIWLGSKCSAMIPASGHHASGLTTTDFLAVDPGLTRTDFLAVDPGLTRTDFLAVDPGLAAYPGDYHAPDRPRSPDPPHNNRSGPFISSACVTTVTIVVLSRCLAGRIT
jgi:hypothetical protein